MTNSMTVKYLIFQYMYMIFDFAKLRCLVLLSAQSG